MLARYDQPVPRYTSYPTAPHFSAAVGADTYTAWLRALPTDAALSLYIHIPFCDSLCWFCGCHMRVVNRYSPIRSYLEALHREIDLVARAMPGRQAVAHLHFGGGSPDILKPSDVWSLIFHLKDLFAFAPHAEVAVEIDPRAADESVIKAWAAAGTTRASIGVQDFDPQVQQAINRVQSFECTKRAMDGLRAAGIGCINIDLLYGLPHQSVASVQRTVDQVVALAPDRIALFGYAHVPWLKAHQRLIDEGPRRLSSVRIPACRGSGRQWRRCATGSRWPAPSCSEPRVRSHSRTPPRSICRRIWSSSPSGRSAHDVPTIPHPIASRNGDCVGKSGACAMVKYSTQRCAVTWSCRIQ